MIPVRISAKSARLPFAGCRPGYIRRVCKAACCRSTTHPDGVLIAIHPSEQAGIEQRGGIVRQGFLRPTSRHHCPFQLSGSELCALHATSDKPFGCIASPFTLNKNDTLIIRNRYKLLKCFDDGPRLPAYIAFRSSLDLLFGLAETERLCSHLASGGGDLLINMAAIPYAMLIENDAIKRGPQR